MTAAAAAEVVELSAEIPTARRSFASCSSTSSPSPHLQPRPSWAADADPAEQAPEGHMFVAGSGTAGIVAAGPGIVAADMFVVGPELEAAAAAGPAAGPAAVAVGIPPPSAFAPSSSSS